MDRRRIYETLLRRLGEPPFVNQTGHAAQVEDLRQAILAIRSRLTPRGLEEARAVYLEATAAAPDDYYLHADFAKLEEDVGNFAEAASQWQTARDEIPFAPGPHYYLGKVLGALGKTNAALRELTEALALRPDLAEALDEKGRLLTKSGRAEEGLRNFEKAAELEPENARIQIGKAEALATLGRRAEAVRQLELAVRTQPGFWEAHYLLGIELALQGEFRPAQEQFAEAARLNPNYPLAHLNLGIALAKLNQPEQAMNQFQETLRLDPQNQKAAKYLEALKTDLSRRQQVPR
ncbi:MAG TPA: tetratricopeptide repeat protein [Verrucomicrobiae bacterium]|nr:tetratricopeptide repeat protein [Verrucomicrobiae bacterium]